MAFTLTERRLQFELFKYLFRIQSNFSRSNFGKIYSKGTLRIHGVITNKVKHYYLSLNCFVKYNDGSLRLECIIPENNIYVL